MNPAGISPPYLSAVIPAYNEMANLPALCARLHSVLAPFGTYEIILVNDGSRDDSLAVMRALAAADSRIRWVDLSRNFGHQRALRAGLDRARGHGVITLDADLQHPPELIPQMVELWRQGADVVSTLRQDPPESSAFKRWSGRTFYRLISALSDVTIEPGSADFRLLDRRVVEAIRALPEGDMFFRGLMPWLGFPTRTLPYVPAVRQAGVSSYTLRKMVSLAVSGLISSSIAPLRLSIFLAGIVGVFALLYAVFAVLIWLQHGSVPGWTSLAVIVSVLGAMQLFVLGIIGEYLGRILRQSLGRPPYLIRQTSDDDVAASPRGAA